MFWNLSNAALCRVSYHAFVNVTKIVTKIYAECIRLSKKAQISFFGMRGGSGENHQGFPLS